MCPTLGKITVVVQVFHQFLLKWCLSFGVRSKRSLPRPMSWSLLPVFLQDCYGFRSCACSKAVFQFHSYTCGCAIFQTLFIKETVPSPLVCSRLLCYKLLTILYMCRFSVGLYSFPLVCVSLLISDWYYF